MRCWQLIPIVKAKVYFQQGCESGDATLASVEDPIIMHIQAVDSVGLRTKHINLVGKGTQKLGRNQRGEVECVRFD